MLVDEVVAHNNQTTYRAVVAFCLLRMLERLGIDLRGLCGIWRGDSLSLSSLGRRGFFLFFILGFATDGDLGQEGKMGMVILMRFEKELFGGMVCVWRVLRGYR